MKWVPIWIIIIVLTAWLYVIGLVWNASIPFVLGIIANIAAIFPAIMIFKEGRNAEL